METHTVDAVQWFKNGDHPQDKLTSAHSDGAVVARYRPVGIDGKTACPRCAQALSEHGKVVQSGTRVCPGDWVVTNANGERYSVRPDQFSATYKRL